MFKGHHWDYFLSLEDDLAKLARYIHFSNENLSTYSIEFARLLMAATQEIDVLFKQICARHGDKSNSEAGYRAFFSEGDYVKIRDLEVSVRSYGLKFTPFKDWTSTAPGWWTANLCIERQLLLIFSLAADYRSPPALNPCKPLVNHPRGRRPFRVDSP